MAIKSDFMYFLPIIDDNRNSAISKIDSKKNTPQFTQKETKLIAEIKTLSNVAAHPIYTNDFNLLRWAQAYESNLQLAAKKYRRHLRIRDILQLDFVEDWQQTDGIDEDADKYAPMTCLGEVNRF